MALVLFSLSPALHLVFGLSTEWIKSKKIKYKIDMESIYVMLGALVIVTVLGIIGVYGTKKHTLAH